MYTKENSLETTTQKYKYERDSQTSKYRLTLDGLGCC